MGTCRRKMVFPVLNILAATLCLQRAAAAEPSAPKVTQVAVAPSTTSVSNIAGAGKLRNAAGQFNFDASKVKVGNANAAVLGNGTDRGGGDPTLLRQQALRTFIQNNLKTAVVDYFIHLDPNDVPDAALGELFKRMLNGGIFDDIRVSQYQVQDSCIVDGGKKGASAENSPLGSVKIGGVICFDPIFMAAENTSQAELVGIAVHEHARHFGYRDEDHKLADYVTKTSHLQFTVLGNPIAYVKDYLAGIQATGADPDGANDGRLAVAAALISGAQFSDRPLAQIAYIFVDPAAGPHTSRWNTYPDDIFDRKFGDLFGQNKLSYRAFCDSLTRMFVRDSSPNSMAMSNSLKDLCDGRHINPDSDIEKVAEYIRLAVLTLAAHR